MPDLSRPIPARRPVPPWRAVPGDRIRHDVVIRAVDQRLNALPATPSTIARALGGLGFCGWRGDADGCVLCRYLTAHLPPGYLLRVDERRVRMWWREVGSDPVFERAITPEVTEFVVGFATGRYPALQQE